MLNLSNITLVLAHYQHKPITTAATRCRDTHPVMRTECILLSAPTFVLIWGQFHIQKKRVTGHCESKNVLDISQGSVATSLRCGGIFKRQVTTSVRAYCWVSHWMDFEISLAMTCRHGHEFRGTFFRTTLKVTHGITLLLTKTSRIFTGPPQHIFQDFFTAQQCLNTGMQTNV